MTRKRYFITVGIIVGAGLMAMIAGKVDNNVVLKIIGLALFCIGLVMDMGKPDPERWIPVSIPPIPDEAGNFFWVTDGLSIFETWYVGDEFICPSDTYITHYQSIPKPKGL